MAALLTPQSGAVQGARLNGLQPAVMRLLVMIQSGHVVLVLQSLMSWTGWTATSVGHLHRKFVLPSRLHLDRHSGRHAA